jgi:PAS domain S-box-containing protein
VKIPQYKSIKSKLAGLFSHPNFWIWMTILLSILVSGTVSWLRYQQQQVIRLETTKLESIRLAQIDMSKGFLYITLAGAQGSPYSRDEGTTLLQQWITSLEQTLDDIEPASTDSKTKFLKDVNAFQTALAEWNTTNTPQPDKAANLRITFHALELQAGKIDSETQQSLDTLSTRLDSEFTTALAVSAFLLAGICSIVLLITLAKEKSELALRESEERYRLLFDSSMDAILLTAPDGSIFSANPAACRMFGRTEEEIVQIGRNGILNSSDPRFKGALEERNRTGRFLGELTFIRKNGEIFPGEISNAVFTDKDGNARTNMTIRDITERKKAEEALRNSEFMLAEAENIGGTGSWQYDVATDSAVWSANMFRIFDVDPEMPKALVFKYFVEHVVHPEDQKHVLEVFQNALAGKGDYDLEYRAVWQDGSVHTVHALAETSFDANGQPQQMVGWAQDITERKRIEEDLIKTQLLLNESQQITKEGGWEYDPVSRQVSWTDEVYRIYGVTKDYDPSRTEEDIDFYATNDKEIVSKAFQQTVEIGESYDLELKLVKASGEEIWVRTMGQAEFKDGKIVRVFGNIMDITERKQQEARLNEQLEELRRWYNITLGREERIIELKHEVNELLEQMGEAKRYSSAEAEISRKITDDL